LTDNSTVEVRGNSGGFININVKDFLLSEQSKIFAGIAEDQGSIDSQAGDITINATDSVKLIGLGPSSVGLGTEINNHVGTVPNRRENLETPSNAVGNGGAVIINTSLLEISDQARITANSYAQGNSGDLVINTDNIKIDGGAIAGLILEGTGDAGNVTINNTDSIILNEGSNIQSQVLKGGQGNVGDIKIDTKTLSIKEKFSFILADNASAGNAGNITINATDSVFINGGGENLGTTLSAILSQVQMDVVGDAGDITIASPQLTLTNFGLISSNVRAGSVGNTGDIFLDVDTLTIDNGSVINALTENDFDGGSINVNVNTVSLSNGGKIVTSGDGGGNGGSINLNIADTLSISSANPPEQVPFQEKILLNTASEAGLFSSTVAGTGDGGSIEIQAGLIELANNGAILATTSTGTGGDVSLRVDGTIELRDNSLISAEAGGMGNGGNINIDTNFIAAFPGGNNDIIANASQGQGGRITINAESLFGIEERPFNDSTNDINASSEFALDGSVNINTNDINPVQGATELPSNVVELEQNTAQACEAGRGTANNGLAIAGKGGVPPAPDTPLNSENIISSEQNSAAFAIPQPIETSQGKIQPARGIKVSKSGKISLTAYRTNNAGERIPEGKINCGQI
jgi:large exoprotein involved in heme utilization and adhesion